MIIKIIEGKGGKKREFARCAMLEKSRLRLVVKCSEPKYCTVSDIELAPLLQHSVMWGMGMC